VSRKRSAWELRWGDGAAAVAFCPRGVLVKGQSRKQTKRSRAVEDKNKHEKPEKKEMNKTRSGRSLKRKPRRKKGGKKKPKKTAKKNQEHPRSVGTPGRKGTGSRHCGKRVTFN